jgi:hypothetical protein
VPIVPVTASATIQSGYVERTQLPLRLAWAITIHKCQGMTLKKVQVSLGPSERTTGITYVALSRVRRLEDLLIDGVNFDSSRLTGITLPPYVSVNDVRTRELIEQTKIDFYRGG